MTLQWTPTQVKILEVLNDGKPHRKEELQACLNDELSSAVPVHITYIRKKLQQIGQDIVCEIAYRRTYYRRVISFTNDD